MRTVEALARCVSCGTPLHGEFCHACGQHALARRSPAHLFQSFLHQLLHIETRAWRTLPLLLVSPGELTRRYQAGQRARFIAPFKLFIFMMALIFAVGWLTSGGDRVATARARSGAAARTGMVADAPGGARGELLRAGKLLRTGWPAADAALRLASANPELAVYRVQSGAAMFGIALLPLSLPFVALLFVRRRELTLADHAAFALYSLSFMALLWALAVLLGAFGVTIQDQAVLLLLAPVHLFAQLRGAYALTSAQAAWRAAALLPCGAAVLSVYLLAVLVLMTG